MLSDSNITELSRTASCREIRDFSKTALRLLKSLYKLLEQFAQTTEPLLEASQMLVSSSQAQSSRITFQRPSHQNIQSSMQESVLTTRQVSHDIHAVADIVNKTLHVAERGQQSVMNARANMEDLHRSSRMSSEKIVALEKHTEHIHEVVATIDRIIEDTKLIAFNATIEAARAKEDGKGFGVVALEIKRLAEEVFDSTEDIKEFIQEIQHASRALVLSTESELKSVQRGYVAATHLRHGETHRRICAKNCHHYRTSTRNQRTCSASCRNHKSRHRAVWT
jgi:methyl-accepting chemotaxis protein